MSDHDRGAYTPHNDAPLSFDARQARGRRAFPTTLLISLVILVGLGVAIFLFYRSGVRGAGQAPAAVGAPVGDIKTAPPADAQKAADAAAGLQIYKSENVAAGSASPPATFAPPPEQPQPRTAPTAPVASQPIAAPAPAPVAAAKPAPVASVPALPVEAAKPPPAASKPVAIPKPATVAAAKPAPKAANDEIGDLLKGESAQSKAAAARTAAAKADTAPKSPATALKGAALVQFGAFSSTDLASSEWSKLAKAYAPDMAGKGKGVESVDRNGKTLFRGAVSGFATRADAVAFCAKLKADSRACIVR